MKTCVECFARCTGYRCSSCEKSRKRLLNSRLETPTMVDIPKKQKTRPLYERSWTKDGFARNRRLANLRLK